MFISRQARIAVIAVSVGASACGQSSAPPDPESINEAASALTPVCPGNQQIGRVQQGAACPAPAAGSAWAYQRLFDGLAPTLPASLEAFCVYTWTGAGPPDHSALPGYLGGPPNSWLDPDCMSVAAMSDFNTAIAAVTPELGASLAAQIEAPSVIPSAPNGADVVVAVVDAWPSVGKIGNFEHGFGMAAIARTVACGSSAAPCFITADPHLALDLVGADVRNPINGGFFGYQSRLARAIAEAVFAHAAAAPTQNLVINLSVGWDGRYNSGLHSVISEPVLAVHAALEQAACSGALVIAAAGNAGAGPTPGGGPVFPAAWEQSPAPSSCVGAFTRPLVYAVGGVNGRDLPLSNARPGARPQLAAPGFVVPGVMNNGSSTVISGPFTGSSVATAVASGIAASIWHQSPGLRPDQVMDYLRSSSVTSPEMADFCLTAPCGHVGRLSLCRALEAVTGSTLSCTKIPIGTGLDPTWSPASSATVQSLVTTTYHANNLLTLVSPPMCSSDVYIPFGLTTFPGPWPCPSETLPNAVTSPTVGPQPPPDPCPACSFQVGGANPCILLAINARVAKAYPQLLSLSDRFGHVRARYDLESAMATSGDRLHDGLVGGNVYRVNMPGITAAYPGDYDYATIEWVNTPDAETSSSLLISN